MISSADWRVEALDLKTGLRKKFLLPLSCTFEERLNDVGPGSLTIPVRSVQMADVWPHSTSIAFLRLRGPGATPVNPVCEYLGLVEDAQADSGGTLQLGMQSIEQYLTYRMIHGDTTYAATGQTAIGASLVNLAVSNGIPLIGTSDASATARDRTYLDTDRKKILEAVQDLTKVIGGPDYRLIHSQGSSGGWSTEMRFSDHVGNTSPSSLNARRGVSSYSLRVDATGQATRVIGVGQSADLVYDTGVPATTYPNNLYPLYEISESYSDVSDVNTVQENAQGTLAQDTHPAANPSVVLAGVDVIAPLSVGDYISLIMSHGAIQYLGVARVTSIAWALNDSSPTTATITLVPQDDAAAAILNAPAEYPQPSDANNDPPEDLNLDGGGANDVATRSFDGGDATTTGYTRTIDGGDA